MKKRIVFVTGVQRSGTMALCDLLNAHPAIAIGTERYKFTYGRNPQDVGPHLFEAERFFDLRPTETNLSAGASYRALREKFDRVALVGDEVPGLQHRLPLLAERFPMPTVVFLIRHPAAVAASWQRRADDPADRWPAENGTERAVREWNLSMEAVRDWRSPRLRLITACYEDLFSGKLLHLRQLLAAMGVGEAPEIVVAFAKATANWADRAARAPELTARQASHVDTHARTELIASLKARTEAAGGSVAALPAESVAVEAGTYDFADFGCSNGKSLTEAQKMFDGRRGIGIDISATKVASARAKGFDVMEGDLTRLHVPDKVFRFVTMSHFLEHLPTPKLAKRCIETGVRTAREFVFIRQPWFAADSYLAGLGLKQYWSDWSGHTNRMDPLAFYLAFRDLPRHWRWRIYGRYKVKDSSDPSIIPLAAPQDAHQYDSKKHGPKPEVSFEWPVYRETVALLCGPSVDFGAVEKRISYAEPLLSSDDLRESASEEAADGTFGRELERFASEEAADGDFGRELERFASEEAALGALGRELERFAADIEALRANADALLPEFAA